MTHDPKTFKVAFAVTEVGPEVSAGDYFTALELGSALRKLLGWEVSWLPKADWYNVGDANALIAMTDHYDLTRLGPKAAGLVKICWMRNWFDRWAGKPHFGMWDIRLCSSLKASEHIKERYGFTSTVLRIGTNHGRFRPRPTEKVYDYVFTGSYWDAPRDIERIDPAAIGLRFALFGKNWENHPHFRAYCKGFVPYPAMPRIYNQSRILVDDANGVTKEWGSVNSRVFDALASGILVITNSESGSAELFNSQLPVYQSPDTLRENLTRYLDDPGLYHKTLQTLRERVLADHTYDIRARELAKIVFTHLQAGQTKSKAPLSSAPRPSATNSQRSRLVSIVIPVFNQAHFTAKCLEAIFTNTPNCYEVIVVDNGSTDGTAQLLAQYGSRIQVIRNAQNQGFARACNSGAAAASTPFVLFLNNDTEVQPDWLPPLLAMGARPRVGAVGSRLLFPDGTVQHAGVVIVERRGFVSLLPRHAFIGESQAIVLPTKATYMQAVTAACILVNTKDFIDVGGFDEAYWNGCEDVDLCFKLAQLGKKIVYEPRSVVVHHEGKSGHQRTIAIPNNNARLRSRWEGLVKPDIIEQGNNIVLAEGFIDRAKSSDELAPDVKYGESLIEWWKRYHTKFLTPKHSPKKKKRIAINICTPNRNSQGWGDTIFGQDLAIAFSQQGHNADIFCKDKWHHTKHDITIHIRGLYRHYPKKEHRNILWIISHPELITKDELDSYDLVFCASANFLRQISQNTSTPCHYLPQASSTKFNIKENIVDTNIELLFIGNNYSCKDNRRRQIVQDVIDAGLGGSLRVIGLNWEKFLPSAMILKEFIPQNMLSHFYRRAKINLNDHPHQWPKKDL